MAALCPCGIVYADLRWRRAFRLRDSPAPLYHSNATSAVLALQSCGLAFYHADKSSATSCSFCNPLSSPAIDSAVTRFTSRAHPLTTTNERTLLSKQTHPHHAQTHSTTEITILPADKYQIQPCPPLEEQLGHCQPSHHLLPRPPPHPLCLPVV